MYAEPMFNAAKLIINLVSCNVFLFKNLTKRPCNLRSDAFLNILLVTKESGAVIQLVFVGIICTIGDVGLGGDGAVRLLGVGRGEEGSGDGLIEAVEIGVTAGDGSDVAFPHADHPPPHGFQLGFVAGVARHVALDLLTPEFHIALRQTVIAASFMAVPEAAVDEDDGLVFRQNDVRASGQFPCLDPESQSTGEEVFAHYHLGLRILALDGRHTSVALFRCHCVCHALSLPSLIGAKRFIPLSTRRCCVRC